MSWQFAAPLWLAGATDAWTFVTVPAEVSDELRELSGPRRGFGSVRVEVTLGETTWRTSVFPDAALGCYVLPVKRAVRDREGVEAPDVVEIGLSLA